jgi:hypothetical protein
MGDELRRCEDLWLSDGTLVVRAENTLFRIYTGVLSLASSVFKDMLGVPQPMGSAAETYEGTPLVLLPDTAFDVEHFLKALVYPGYVLVSASQRLLDQS